MDIPQSAAEVLFDFTAICDRINEGLEYVELEIVIPDEYRSRVKAISPNMTRVNIIGKLLCICICTYVVIARCMHHAYNAHEVHMYACVAVNTSLYGTFLQKICFVQE